MLWSALKYLPKWICQHGHASMLAQNDIRFKSHVLKFFWITLPDMPERLKNLGFYCEFVAKIFLQPAQKPKKCRWESSCLWLKVQRCVRWLVKETLWTVPRSSCIKHRGNYPLSILEHTHKYYPPPLPPCFFPSLSLPLSLGLSRQVPDRPSLQWLCSKHWARIARALGR